MLNKIMELKEILSISGAPGLYKYVAQGKGGIIVESLADSRRTLVGGSAKVSALGDIAIFTDADEVSLADVFHEIFEKNNGAIAINNKSTNEELHAFMSEILPAYDRDRVHTSDIKKLASWYNLLVAAGMTTFKAKQEEAAEEGAPIVAAAKPKVDPTVAVAKKQAAKNITPKASTSQPRAATSKTSTNRKSS